MTDWTNVGLRQHQPANFRGTDSQRVDDFVAASDSHWRPDALYKLADNGDVLIFSGAAVTRNRGKMAPFKRFWSGAGFKLLDVMSTFGVSIRAEANLQRKLRHAEYALDHAVNQFVADVANETQNIDLRARMQEIKDLHADVVDKLGQSNKQLDDKGLAWDKVMDRVETNMAESIQAAIKAKPKSAGKICRTLERLTTIDLKDPGVGIGVTDFNAEPSAIMNDGWGAGMVQQRLRAGVIRAAQANVVENALPDDLHLAQCFENGTLGKQPVSADSIRFLNGIVIQTKKGQHPKAIGHKAMTQLAQQLGRLKPDEAAELMSDLGLKACTELFEGSGALNPSLLKVDINTLKTENRLPEVIAELEAVYAETMKAREHMVRGLASNLDTLRDLSLAKMPSGQVIGSAKMFIIEANREAATLRDEDGQFVHGSKELEEHLEQIFTVELGRQDKAAPLRFGTTTPALLAGMIDRYTDYALDPYADAAIQSVKDGGRVHERGFKPDNGPPTEGAVHPELVLKALKVAMGKFKQPPEPSDRVKHLFDKIQQGFVDSGDKGGDAAIDPAFERAGKSFVSGLMFLRTIGPKVQLFSLDSDESAATRELATRVSQLMQAVGNNEFKNIPSRVREIETKYINAVKKEHFEKHGVKMTNNDVEILKSKLAPVMNEILCYARDQFGPDSTLGRFQQSLTGIPFPPTSRKYIDGQAYLDGQEHRADLPPSVLDAMSANCKETLDDEIKRDLHAVGEHGVAKSHVTDFLRAKFTMNGVTVSSNNRKEFDGDRWLREESGIPEDQVPESPRERLPLIAKQRWLQVIRNDKSTDANGRVPPREEDLQKLTTIVNQSIFATVQDTLIGSESPQRLNFVGSHRDQTLQYDFETTNKPGVYKVHGKQTKQRLAGITNFGDPEQRTLNCDPAKSKSAYTFDAVIDLNDLDNPVTFTGGSAIYQAVPGDGQDPLDAG